MNIQITATVRINMEDSKNYTIEKQRIVKEGKNAGVEFWDTVGHYGDLKGAAQALLGRHFSLINKEIGPARDMKHLIEVIDEGAYLIANACAKAVEGQGAAA